MHNRFRIIGGQWRRRRLAFPGVPGIRPSPDRVRETLFNWLAPVIDGARCLDLYAGSGALGIEALSRGAAAAVFVDRDRTALAAIEAHLEALRCDAAETVNSTAAAFLGRPPARPFDVVFLDPPYRQGLLAPACDALAADGWLASPAFVYLEAETGLAEPALPAGWCLHRSGTAGQVAYRLATVD